MTINRSTLNASLHGLTAVGVSLLLASCASSTPAATAKAPATPAAVAGPAPINDLCPITGDTSDPKFSAAYKGRSIAFCCENCLREFRETDEAGRAAIAAKVRP